MDAMKGIASLLENASRSMRRRPPGRRRTTRWAPEAFAPLEMRAVPTVSAVAGTPFEAPGLDQDWQNHGPTATATIVGEDKIRFELTGGVPNSLVTFSLYSSPAQNNKVGSGNHDNMAAQILEYKEVIRLDGQGNATYCVDIKKLLDSGKIDLRGQRHFQCDFWYDHCNPKNAYCPPAKFTPGHDYEAAVPNLVHGWLFDYSDKGKR